MARAPSTSFDDQHRKEGGRPDEARALRAAIIGCPNVGKSALTNALVRSPVCAVSRLIDTTRANTAAALTENECQLVVVDSPGLVSSNHAKNMIGTHTDDHVLTHPEKAIERAEQIVVVQDATASGEYMKHRILYMLHRFSHIPACLVLNKIDMIERRSDLLKLVELLTEGIVDGQPIQTKALGMGIISSIISKAKKDRGESVDDANLGIRPVSSIKEGKERDEQWHALYNKLLHRPAYRASWRDTRTLFGTQVGWPHFKAVFFVSAKTGEGVDGLRDYLRKNAIKREWKFAPEMISKKDPKLLCAEHLRSILMDILPANIAYKLRMGIAHWEMDEERGNNNSSELRVAMNVFTENTTQARMIWYRCETIEHIQREKMGALFARPVAFRLLIRVKDSRGVYTPSEADEEWNRRRTERREAKKREKEAMVAEAGEEEEDF